MVILMRNISVSLTLLINKKMSEFFSQNPRFKFGNKVSENNTLRFKSSFYIKTHMNDFTFLQRCCCKLFNNRLKALFIPILMTLLVIKITTKSVETQQKLNSHALMRWHESQRQKKNISMIQSSSKLAYHIFLLL